MGLDGFSGSCIRGSCRVGCSSASRSRGRSPISRVLLMDEPFASVDAQTRADLEDLVLQVHADFGITVVFVTHDVDESIYLADRIIVLTQRPTRVKEIVSVSLPRPRDQMATKAVAEFARPPQPRLPADQERAPGLAADPPTDSSTRRSWPARVQAE